MENVIKKHTGMLVFEVKNSHINGDPDLEGTPRTNHEGMGFATPFFFKALERRLLVNPQNPFTKEFFAKCDIDVEEASKSYCIFESLLKGFDVKDQKDALTKAHEFRHENGDEAFLDRYWDTRVFGTTFLEENKDKKKDKKDDENRVSRQFKRSQVVNVGVADSINKIKIKQSTITKQAPVQDTKDSGMAPSAFKVVEYGLYVMPFSINPHSAADSRCTQKDVDIFLRLLPFVYEHTTSSSRNNIDMVHAWIVEHKSTLGDVSDCKIWDKLRPTLADGINSMDVTNRSQVVIPTELNGINLKLRDLVAEREEWVK